MQNQAAYALYQIEIQTQEQDQFDNPIKWAANQLEYLDECRELVEFDNGCMTRRR